MLFSLRLFISILTLLMTASIAFDASNAYASRCEALWLQSSVRADIPTTAPLAAQGPGFVIPNEKNISQLKPLIASAVEGLIISVGTERGPMTAGLIGRNAKALVQVDVDSRIVIFNLINRSLLELATSREDYLKLRLDTSTRQLAKRLSSKTSKISAEGKEILSSPTFWKWWVDNVQTNRLWDDLHRADGPSYRHANYLHDDVLFQHVSSLAKQGRIFVFQDNLGSTRFQNRVRYLSQALALPISIFDFSNAWEEGYLGFRGTIETLESLGSSIDSASRFVFTYQTLNAQQQSGESTFNYLTVRRNEISALSQLGQTFSLMTRQDPSRAPTKMDRVGRSRNPNDF